MSAQSSITLRSLKMGLLSGDVERKYYDSVADGSSVYGLGTYTTYNTSGVATHYLLKIDDSGNLKKLDPTLKTWSTITGKTYTTGINTEFIQGEQLSAETQVAYMVNGVDN